MMYKVYAHINKLNKKIYIGITKQNVQKRWQNGKGYTHSSYFYNAINKYGWNNFEHIVLVDNLELEDANYFEKELIKIFNTQNNQFGYNLDSGGDAKTHSEITKQRISKTLKGQKRSEETLYKLSISHKGKKRNPEAVRKTAEANRGKKLSAWHKRRISESMRNNKHGQGYIHSDEAKQKISTKLKGNMNGRKYIQCVETLEIYTSMKYCEEMIGKSAYCIRKAIKNNTSLNGLHYIFLKA